MFKIPKQGHWPTPEQVHGTETCRKHGFFRPRLLQRVSLDLGVGQVLALLGLVLVEPIFSLIIQAWQVMRCSLMQMRVQIQSKKPLEVGLKKDEKGTNNTSTRMYQTILWLQWQTGLQSAISSAYIPAKWHVSFLKNADKYGWRINTCSSSKCGGHHYHRPGS